LDGFDEDWSHWTTETKKEYTNLPEGEYIFQVKARNIYDFESKPATYEFEILPPLHRTWWAYSSYIILLIILIWIIVKLNTKQHIKAKIRLEKIVEERTFEISQQNEEIKMQADNLFELNDEITKKNEELSQQNEEIQIQSDYLIDLNSKITEKNTRLFQQKKEIETIVKELKISNDTKDKLFSIIAHDLKNPFNVIFGYTDLLKESYNEFSEVKRKDFINEIDKSSKSAYQLLENLLLWALSQQGKIEIEKEETNLKQLIIEAVSPYFHSAKKKKITFTNSVSDNITVSVDEQTIKTVIANLFSNAVKFTPNNGHILINAAIIDKFVEIKISDNGVGISNKVQSKIFRIDESHSTPGTNNEKGTGLGLSLCKEFVEKNGGKIWVESEEGVGSQFYFTIPYTTYKNEITENNGAKSEVKPELQIKKLKILIAEDDKMAEKYLENVLKNISKEILFAKNGIEAIETISQNPDIDLVLMDIQMPEMSGYEATRKIREFNKDVVIIAETAYAISGDREKALEAGCNDYISKPIKKNRLMEMIEKYFVG